MLIDERNKIFLIRNNYDLVFYGCRILGADDIGWMPTVLSTQPPDLSPSSRNQYSAPHIAIDLSPSSRENDWREISLPDPWTSPRYRSLEASIGMKDKFEQRFGGTIRGTAGDIWYAVTKSKESHGISP